MSVFYCNFELFYAGLAKLGVNALEDQGVRSKVACKSKLDNCFNPYSANESEDCENYVDACENEGENVGRLITLIILRAFGSSNEGFIVISYVIVDDYITDRGRECYETEENGNDKSTKTVLHRMNLISNSYACVSPEINHLCDDVVVVVDVTDAYDRATENAKEHRNAGIYTREYGEEIKYFGKNGNPCHLDAELRLAVAVQLVCEDDSYDGGSEDSRMN